MDEVNAKIGTDYKPFNYYGAPDAKHIIIAMGSVCDTIAETIDYLNAKGEKVGMVKVHLYRPFSAKYLLDVIPSTVEKISVIDRTKEPGSPASLFILMLLLLSRVRHLKTIPVYNGRYGLAPQRILFLLILFQSMII